MKTKTKIHEKEKAKASVTPKKIRVTRIVNKKVKATQRPALNKKANSKRKSSVVEEASIKSDSVKLPSVMPETVVVKANDLRKELDGYISLAVQRVAYVSAFCFISVGATLTLLNVLPSNLTNMQQTAVVSDFETKIQQYEATNITKIDLAEPTVAPAKFEFLTAFPQQITEDFRVNFRATNVEKTTVKLISPQYSGFFELDSSSMLEDKYRTDIKPNSYPAGYYKLVVYIVPKDGSGIKAYTSTEFLIGNPETKSISEVNTVDKKRADVMNEVSIDSEAEEKVEEEDEEEAEVPLSELKIIGEKTISDIAKIEVSYPKDLKFIELYTRPINTLDYRFISLATKRSGNWVFEFNTRDLPNGEYELVAKSKDSNKEIRSNQIIIKVSNSVTSSIPPKEPVIANSENVTENVTESVSEDRFLDIDFNDSNDNVISDETNTVLADNKSKIEDLLRRYATAIQSDNKTLISVAERELLNTRKGISNEILSSDLADLSDDIDLEVDEQIKDLMQRVQKFEQLRKTKSTEDLSSDTDGDGISDFDEVSIFQTDPQNADTDKDGFNDGIEVVRGYDPTDDTPEAIINYESPREFKGLERDDVLNVESVIPVIPENSELSPIQAEIRGRALPNSFVTLYIFSSPTVITVKTDPDGTFVYVFSKELEDGEHEVFAAVTDNTGSIIAQSKSFSFIKTAEAFTTVDSEKIAPVTISSSDPVLDTTYKTVLGMAVLVLGVILLMLGIGLRIKNTSSDIGIPKLNPKEKEVSDMDPKTSFIKLEGIT